MLIVTWTESLKDNQFIILLVYVTVNHEPKFHNFESLKVTRNVVFKAAYYSDNEKVKSMYVDEQHRGLLKHFWEKNLITNINRKVLLSV